MENKKLPHAKYKFLVSLRCGAKTRSGHPCKAPAMKNGRCRMHGGKSTGPKPGTRNALKHGYYTREAIEKRKQVAQLLRVSKSLLKGPTHNIYI